MFAPAQNGVYDLRKQNAAGAELLRELVAFCNLDADTSVLDGASVDRDDWRELVAQVQSCFEPKD